MRHNLLKNKVFILVFLVVLLAGFLRFYRFYDRWGLGSDDMRDVAIAKEAIVRHEFPLIGSFSSAGPFVFGPLFYWFIMLSFIILPFTITAPWIFLTLIGMTSVYFFFRIGGILSGKRLALILGILAATSPQLILRSIALNQHSLVGITTILLIFNYILIWQKQKLKYAFFMGLSLGIALNMHYQAINLFIFFPLVLFVPKLSLKKKIYSLVLMFLGFILPTLPILWWDSHQNFANIRNILDYFLIGQYRIYVPNSWKLFIFNFLPSYWFFVEGGYFLISSVILVFFCISVLFLIINKKVNRITAVLFITFFLLLVLNRYYKGERSEGYLMYLTPFVIIITGWCIDQVLNIKKNYTFQNVIGYGLFAIIVFGNILFATTQILSAYNNHKEIERIRDLLINKYPSQKISLYDFEWKTSNKSYPLSAFLKLQNKTGKHGIPIAVMPESSLKNIDQSGVIIFTTSRYEKIVDLTNEKTFNLHLKRWVRVNQEDIYDDLMKWTKTQKLISSFTLFGY